MTGYRALSVCRSNVFVHAAEIGAPLAVRLLVVTSQRPARLSAGPRGLHSAKPGSSGARAAPVPPHAYQRNKAGLVLRLEPALHRARGKYLPCLDWIGQ